MKLKVTYHFQPAVELPVRSVAGLKPAAQRKKTISGRAALQARLLQAAGRLRSRSRFQPLIPEAI
jgi:hypothetical protein